MSPSAPELDLQVRHQLGDSWLSVEYRVRNLTAQPVFLFNVLHRDFDAGVFPLDPSGYVEVGSDEVTVSRKLFPVPPFTLPESRNIPFMTRIAPHEGFGETVHLVAPLTERHPYQVEAPPTAGTDERVLVFELGYFVGAAGTEQLGKMYPTDAGMRPGFDTVSESSQKLVRSARLGSVPVRLPR